MKTLHELLPLIRKRPQMFIAEPSLTDLWHLILGYQMGIVASGGAISSAHSLPDDFHDWVAYRLHFRESTAGWRRMILDKSLDEAKAFYRFFELYDEHAVRKAHVFARLLDIRKAYRVSSGGRERRKRYPKSISFVTYTSDPGFFVYSDEPRMPWPDRFYPQFDRFETFHSIKRTQLTIIDPVTFDRLNKV